MSESNLLWVVKCPELRSDPMTLPKAKVLKDHWDKTAMCKQIHTIVRARPRSSKKTKESRK